MTRVQQSAVTLCWCEGADRYQGEQDCGWFWDGGWVGEFVAVAGVRRAAELGSPGCEVGWCVDGVQVFAPDDVVSGVDVAVGVEVACGGYAEVLREVDEGAWYWAEAEEVEGEVAAVAVADGLAGSGVAGARKAGVGAGIGVERVDVLRPV